MRLRRRSSVLIGFAVMAMLTAPLTGTASPSSYVGDVSTVAPPPVPAPAPAGSGANSTPISGSQDGGDLAAAAACLAYTRGDDVHVTAGQASGHGSWDNVNCSATRADVIIQLQQYYADGVWRDVGAAGVKRVRSGGGGGRRANARVTCFNTLVTGWRSVVDVDLVGLIDDDSVLITPTQNLRCRR